MPRCAPESDSTRCSTDRIGRRSRTVFRLSAAGSSGSGRSGAASDRGDLALVVELYFPSVREVDADTVNVSITGAEAFAFVDDDADIFTVEDLSLAAAPVVLHLRTACRLLFKSRPCMALALRDPYAHGIRKRLARSSEPATMERHGLARGVGRAARRLSVSRGFLCRGAPPGTQIEAQPITGLAVTSGRESRLAWCHPRHAGASHVLAGTGSDITERRTLMTADRPVSRESEFCEEVRSAVPYGLRVAAAVSGRLLAVAAAPTVVGFVAVKLALVLVPVAVALLLAGLFSPAVSWLARKNVAAGRRPRSCWSSGSPWPAAWSRSSSSPSPSACLG